MPPNAFFSGFHGRCGDLVFMVGMELSLFRSTTPLFLLLGLGEVVAILSRSVHNPSIQGLLNTASPSIARHLQNDYRIGGHSIFRQILVMLFSTWLIPFSE